MTTILKSNGLELQLQYDFDIGLHFATLVSFQTTDTAE